MKHIHIFKNKRAIIRLSDVGSTYNAPQQMGSPDRVTVSACAVLQCTRKLEHREERNHASTANRNRRPCVSFAKQGSPSLKRTLSWNSIPGKTGEEALPPSANKGTSFAASPELKPAQALKVNLLTLQGLFA